MVLTSGTLLLFQMLNLHVTVLLIGILLFIGLLYVLNKLCIHSRLKLVHNNYLDTVIFFAVLLHLYFISLFISHVRSLLNDAPV